MRRETFAAIETLPPIKKISLTIHFQSYWGKEKSCVINDYRYSH